MVLYTTVSKKIVFFVCLCVLASLVAACTGTSTGPGVAGASNIVHVVAAENFYGDIAMQLGGGHVVVTSILSDPNVDPHEYTSNIRTAAQVSSADLVIENGLGYDSWMDKLLASSPNAHRVVLTAGAIADHALPDNPHVWYGIDNMPAITKAITGALKKLDSADASMFDHNLAVFEQSLTPLQQKIDEIHTRYAGTPIALTETIYLYQTGPEGLQVLTPYAFMKANAEGNDPPADTVTAINNELSQKLAKVLIYNVQTVTPLTTNVQNEAKSRRIPIVPVSETMPPGKTYQSWMMDQLNTLEMALAQGTGK